VKNGEKNEKKKKMMNKNYNNNINPKSYTFGFGLQIYWNLPTKNIGEKYLQKRNTFVRINPVV
jgi:hypothetical protein